MLSKVGLIAAAILYYPSCFIPLMAIGCLIKYVIRSGESYHIGSNQLVPRPHIPRPVLPEQQRNQNILKWMQKWICDSYFTLFALGMTDIDLSSRSNAPVTIYIGEDGQQYVGDFVAEFLFFEAMLRWNVQEANTIRLTADFNWTHEQLRNLERCLTEGTALREEQYPLNDFLMRIFDKTPHSLVADVQRALLSGSPLPHNPYFEGRVDLSESPPGVKVGSHSFNLIPCPEYIEALDKIDDVRERKAAVIRCLNTVAELENEDHKCYFYNKIMNEFMTFLHHKVHRERIDPWPMILETLRTCQECAQKLTILSLPCSFIQTADVNLGQFLSSLPNLLWLQIDIFSQELNMDQLVYTSEKLRVFSLNGQDVTTEVAQQIKDRFPNADVIELQVLRR
jgi:hypothetical protein